jgi:hypothetical protein
LFLQLERKIAKNIGKIWSNARSIFEHIKEHRWVKTSSFCHGPLSLPVSSAAASWQSPNTGYRIQYSWYVFPCVSVLAVWGCVCLLRVALEHVTPHCSWDAPQIFDVAARRPSCFQAQKWQCLVALEIGARRDTAVRQVQRDVRNGEVHRSWRARQVQLRCVHHPKLPEELLSAQVQQQATAMNQGPRLGVVEAPKWNSKAKCNSRQSEKLDKYSPLSYLFQLQYSNFMFVAKRFPSCTNKNLL